MSVCFKKHIWEHSFKNKPIKCEFFLNVEYLVFVAICKYKCFKIFFVFKRNLTFFIRCYELHGLFAKNKVYLLMRE